MIGLGDEGHKQAVLIETFKRLGVFAVCRRAKPAWKENDTNGNEKDVKRNRGKTASIKKRFLDNNTAERTKRSEGDKHGRKHRKIA